MIEITLLLPMPTSTNRLHRHARGRTYISAAYAEWMRTAYPLARIQARERSIQNRFGLRVDAPAGTRKDLDNLLKAVLDLAQAISIVKNDSRSDSVSIQRNWSRNGDDIIATFFEMPDAPVIEKKLARKRVKD